MKLILITVITVLVCSACQREPVQELPTAATFNNPLQSLLDKDVHQLYQQYQQKMGAVSLAIGVLINNRFHHYGYGNLQIGSPLVPDSNTYYEIGSISKVFTALATAHWLQRNGLPLTTPVNAYLPSWVAPLQKNGTAVTFRHLLTHTAGLDRDPASILASANIPQAYANYDSNLLYGYLHTTALRSKPGTLYDYSNTGFATLGTILERQTGKSYAALIKETITDPLDMARTKVELLPGEQAQMALPYEGNIVQPLLRFAAFKGAGALKSTTGDLLRFARAYIDYPWQPALAQAMQYGTQVHYNGPQAGGGNTESGLAWSYLALAANNTHVLTHSGTTFGHGSVLVINRQDKKALVMFVTLPGTAQQEAALQDFGNQLILRALQ
jgi:CubicO group peptidase (beta-lactamase class C family)